MKLFDLPFSGRHPDSRETENQLSSLYSFNPERGSLFVKVDSFLRVGHYYSMGE